MGYLLTEALSHSSAAYWIGLTDFESEGNYVWAHSGYHKYKWF